MRVDHAPNTRRLRRVQLFGRRHNLDLSEPIHNFHNHFFEGLALWYTIIPGALGSIPSRALDVSGRVARGFSSRPRGVLGVLAGVLRLLGHGPEYALHALGHLLAAAVHTPGDLVLDVVAVRLQPASAALRSEFCRPIAFIRREV